MKKWTCCLLVFTMFLFNFFIAENLRADCVSQYCTCDGQMHPCDFSEEECKALCGGSEPGYKATYHNSDMDALYLGFAVAFVAIGVVLYFTGAFDEQSNKSMTKIISF